MQNKLRIIYFMRGNILGVINTRSRQVEQRTDYYPYGMPHGNASGAGLNSRKYSGKEPITFAGYDAMDYHARWRPTSLPLFTTPDPKSEEFYPYSLYVYCGGDPVNNVDPNGEELIVVGFDEQNVINQLQLSTNNRLLLATSQSGHVIYGTNPFADINGTYYKRLQEVIDNSSITVVINSTSGYMTSSGRLFVGGAFMGNNIYKNKFGKISAVAYQTVNPKTLGTMSEASGIPGTDMLHEVTEAYEGAKISIDNGVDSSSSSEPGSVYIQAHDKAVPQSNRVFLRMFDSDGNVTKNITDAVSGYWFVNDIIYNEVIIQRYP